MLMYVYLCNNLSILYAMANICNLYAEVFALAVQTVSMMLSPRPFIIYLCSLYDLLEENVVCLV